MEPIFFKNWEELWRAALFAVVTYAAFVILLRVSGKRTLLKMNVFDFVIVVAIGSILASTIITPEITVSKGLVGCATLVFSQVIVSWIVTRSPRLEKIINGNPTLLLHKGQFLRDVMKRQRVTEEEIRAAVRAHGVASLENIQSVILETDGTFSVVWKKTDESKSGLKDVAEQEKNHDRSNSD
jgi:uncharacterized membrane protein YcaP (DUF421 family)